LTINSSILTERQRVIVECIRMRLNEKRSLEYLKEVGFEIGPATFYREKRKVEEMKLKRLYHIAKIGFQDQHLDRIDNTELCLKLMWENYHLEKDPYKRFQMLKDIIMVQPYLSSYYEATHLIIAKQQGQQQYQNNQEETDSIDHYDDGDDDDINDTNNNSKF
jgi:hypothetical protein